MQEISQISRALKLLARELDVPVMALSQLSRAVEQRGDKDRRPQLSDLRESGSIEQDADVVMFIYRDDYYDSESEQKGEAEIIIAKHRNGPVGSVNLAYQGRYTRFADLARGAAWRSGAPAPSWSAPSGVTRARARSSTCWPRRADVVARYQGGNNAGHTVRRRARRSSSG